MAIRRDRRVQGDSIKSASTRRRPIPDPRRGHLHARKPPLGLRSSMANLLIDGMLTAVRIISVAATT
jgi:hypothetical protein